MRLKNEIHLQYTENQHKFLYENRPDAKFIVIPAGRRFGKTKGASNATIEWMAEGKIQYKVDIVEGIENAPSAVNKLFTGENTGKLVIKVSDEP